MATKVQGGIKYEQNTNEVMNAILNGSQEIFTSIKYETPAQKANLYNLLNETETNVSDVLNQEIDVTDFIAYSVKVLGDSGAYEYSTRVIIVDKQGEAYATVSEGIYDNIKQIVAIFGMAPWNGLKMIPIEKNTRNGFKVLTLRVVG